MDRKVAVVYTVFSVIACVFLAVWTAESYYQMKADNFMNAANTFTNVRNSVAVTLGEQGRFDTPGFRSFIRSLFLEDPRIDVLTVESAAGDVQYVYARNASALQSPNIIDNQWNGSLRYNQVSQHLFSAPLPYTVAAGDPPMRLRAVFTVVSGSDLYFIARKLLIAVMAFVILTGIVLLILPFLARRRESRPQPVGPDRAASVSTNAATAETDEAEAVGTAGQPPPSEGISEPIERSETVPTEPTQPVEQPQVAATEESEAPSSTPQAAGPAATVGEASISGADPGAEPEAYGESDEVPTEAPDIATEAGTPTVAAPVREVEREPEMGGGDDLPPGVQLPSLQEVLGEEPAPIEPGEEIEFFEELGPEEAAESSPTPVASTGPAVPPPAAAIDPDIRMTTSEGKTSSGGLFEVTEIEEPADQRKGSDGAAAESSYRSAEEEIEDLEEVEDLEAIDGHHPPQSDEGVTLTARPPSDQRTQDEQAEREGSEIPADEDEAVEVEEIVDVEELPPMELEPIDLEEGGPSLDDEGVAEEPQNREQTRHSGEAARELFNPETGLAWQDHMNQRLSFELDRAASFDQDLSVCIMRFAEKPDRDARLAYSRFIRQSFPFHDLCFEFGDDGFALVLPNTDIDQAIKTMESISDKVGDAQLASSIVFMGLSARNGRLLSAERLLGEAETAVKKAEADGTDRIVALRVDPGKYREYIKSTLE